MKFFPSKLSSAIGTIAVIGGLVAVGCSCSGGTKGGGSTTSSTDGTPTPGKDSVKIGLVASLNGDLRPWGVDSKAGADLAVEEFNKAGGLNGKQVQLLTQDSNSKPEQGKSAAEKLLSDGVIGIVGEVASGITAALAEPAKDKGVPVIAVGATRTDLTANTNDVFRVCYTDAFQGPVMATFAFKELNLRKVAIMTDKKQPYSVGLSKSFRDFFIKLGGQIIDEQFYESGKTQFSGQLTNLKAETPDGLFCSGYFNEVGPIVKQAREAGITCPCFGGDGWDSREILNTGGQAIVGSFFCNHYNNREQRPEVVNFLKLWKDKYSQTDSGEVPATTMGALAYDATKLMLDALKRADAKAGGKAVDSKALRDAIDETENFPGVSGAITLKGNHGNPPKAALVVKLTDDPAVKSGQDFAKRYEYTDIFPAGSPSAGAAAPQGKPGAPVKK